MSESTVRDAEEKLNLNLRRFSLRSQLCENISVSCTVENWASQHTFICGAEEGVNTDWCFHFSSTRWRPGLTWTNSWGARVPKGKVLIVSQACSNLPLWLAGCIHTTAVLSAAYKKNFPGSVHLRQCENSVELWWNLTREFRALCTVLVWLGLLCRSKVDQVKNQR